MVDFTITTTANFDAGTKSQSSSNREVITISDVVSGAANSPAADELQLENLYSDKFDLADADGLTAKLEQANVLGTDAGTFVSDIDTTVNDAYYMKVTHAGGIRAYKTTNLKQKLTGAFDVRVNVDATSRTLNTHVSFFLYKDATNYALLEFLHTGTTRSVLKVGGTSTITPVTSSDNEVSFRITRDAANVIAFYYDLAGGNSWTLIYTAAGFSGDVYVCFDVASGITDGYVTEANYKSLAITSGTFASGGYRTSGNWTSASQTMTAGKLLYDLNLSHSGLDANNYIDKIEILDASDDSILTTYAGNITTGATTTLTASDFDNGFNSTLDTNIKIKLYLVGSGSATPVITEITGNYASGAANFRFDGETFGANPENFRFDGGTW